MNEVRRVTARRRKSKTGISTERGEMKYPIMKRNTTRGLKVGISSVYVCGNLHRSFEVIYAVPGSWSETTLEWCESVPQALVQILVNEYDLVQCDYFDWSWMRA